MKYEVYGRLKCLVDRIDDLSTSAGNISKLSEEIRNDNGEANFFVCTKNGTSTTTLSKELSITICGDILGRYHELIKEAQKEMNDIINGLYAKSDV